MPEDSGTDVLALIPARGGSKGLPGKNIRPFAGLPLIAHSILLARMCPEIDCTVVSTDSDEIAGVAAAHGAEVPFLRPAELARDDTAMWPVVRHALEEMERNEESTFQYLLLLDPTTPTRLPEDISGALSLLAGHPEADGAIGFSRPAINPLWNSWQERDGWMVPMFDESNRYRTRQEAPEIFQINAMVYAWRTAFVKGEPETPRAGKTLRYEIPHHRVVHIDDIEEFRKAEALVACGFFQLPWLARG